MCMHTIPVSSRTGRGFPERTQEHGTRKSTDRKTQQRQNRKDHKTKQTNTQTNKKELQIQQKATQFLLFHELEGPVILQPTLPTCTVAVMLCACSLFTRYQERPPVQVEEKSKDQELGQSNLNTNRCMEQEEENELRERYIKGNVAKTKTKTFHIKVKSVHTFCGFMERQDP